MINDFSRTSLIFKTDWLIMELNDNISPKNTAHLKELNLIRDYLLLESCDRSKKDECLEKNKRPINSD